MVSILIYRSMKEKGKGAQDRKERGNSHGRSRDRPVPKLFISYFFLIITVYFFFENN